MKRGRAAEEVEIRAQAEFDESEAGMEEEMKHQTEQRRTRGVSKMGR